MLEVGKRALLRAVLRLRYAKAMSLTRPQYREYKSLLQHASAYTLFITISMGRSTVFKNSKVWTVGFREG